MDKVIKLYNYVDGVNDTPFPDKESQVILTDFRYDAKRMGGAPSLTSTFMHHVCLDKMWSYNVYTIINGERMFLKSIPTSSFDNTDARYKHEAEFVSERMILDNVFFYDVVDDKTTDRPVSNNANFTFFGTLREFVDRLNYSLRFSSVPYSAEVNLGINTDAKQITFSNLFITQALQEAFKVFEVPYYFDKHIIHFGITSNKITDTFKYGCHNSLLSIRKQNSNFRIVNRITGCGSEDNIPYYYPNNYESKEEAEAHGETWIREQKNLMPSIYRESLGKERFYNAVNNKYKIPESSEYYEFENEFVEGHPMEFIVDFPDIKPSIKGMTNASGQRIDTFADFAYDADDNDEKDEEDNFIHPYFFGKLRKFDGKNGFNLFSHAIDESEMTFSMTSGSCGSCEFVLGVDDETKKNTVQVDEKGNLIRDTKGNVIVSGSPQDSQNDTSKNEVWIALKKDITTFGVVMPNATHNYRPSLGDSFVILHIKLPLSYIKEAEEKLTENLIRNMALNNSEKFNFSIGFSRIYLQNNPRVLSELSENSMIQIEYDKSFYELYVSSYSYSMKPNEPLPEINVELTETLIIAQNAIQTAIDGLKSEIVGGLADADFFKQGLRYFLRKDIPDTARGFLKLIGGADIGKFIKGEQGTRVDTQGNVITQKIESHGFNYGALGTGFQLKNDPKTNRSYLEVDELFVRIKALFTELEIRKLSYAGGNWIFSPAGAKCSRVEEFDTYYRCYFTAEQDGIEVENEFRVNDQVRCQEFNVKVGVNKNVSNRYYWRLCVNIGKDYIDLSKTDYDHNMLGNDAPMAGDDMVCLGNRTDKERQNAIVISAYGEGSPSFTQHIGINSYSLKGTEKTRISPYGNVFTGDFISKSGSNLEEDIDDKIGGIVVGGRNILRSSKIVNQKADESGKVIAVSCFSAGIWRNDKTWQNNTNWRMSNILMEGNSYNHYTFTPTINLKADTDYVFSIDKTVINSGSNVPFFDVAIYDSSLLKVINTVRIAVSFQKQEVVVRTSKDLIPSNNNQILFYTGLAGMSEGRSMTWHGVQLCEGNKGTGWTPAPEDNEDRLNEWASDGIISPMEKKGLKEEIQRIDADKRQIDLGYQKYSLGVAIDFNGEKCIYAIYRGQLGRMSQPEPETIKVEEGFTDNVSKYYNARSKAFNAIEEAEKGNIDGNKRKATREEIARIEKDYSLIHENFISFGIDVEFKDILNAYDDSYTLYHDDLEYILLSPTASDPDDIVIHRNSYYENRKIAMSQGVKKTVSEFERTDEAIRAEVKGRKDAISGLRTYTDGQLVIRDEAIKARVTSEIYEVDKKGVLTRLSSAEGKISTQAGLINANTNKITNVDGRLEKAESEIRQTPDKISLAVKNIQIGSVNKYGSKSELWDATSGIDNVSFLKQNANGFAAYIGIEPRNESIIRIKNIVKDGFYTVSGKIKVDNTNTYVHVQFSDKSNPSSTGDMSNIPKKFIGLYSDSSSIKSSNPKDYAWINIEYSDGYGIALLDKNTKVKSYCHILYRNDKNEIGIYVDFVQQLDSNQVSWYSVSSELPSSYMLDKNFSESQTHLVDVLINGLPIYNDKDQLISRFFFGGNEWTYFEVTLDSQRKDGYVDFIFNPFGGLILIKDLMIENGNKATDWKPATEEMTSKEDMLDTGIDIERHKITLTADETYIRDNNGNNIAFFGADSTGGIKFNSNVYCTYIQATSGTIGGFNISDTGIEYNDQKGNIVRVNQNGLYASDKDGYFYAGRSGISLNNHSALRMEGDSFVSNFKISSILSSHMTIFALAYPEYNCLIFDKKFLNQVSNDVTLDLTSRQKDGYQLYIKVLKTFGGSVTLQGIVATKDGGAGDPKGFLIKDNRARLFVFCGRMWYEF